MDQSPSESGSVMDYEDVTMGSLADSLFESVGFMGVTLETLPSSIFDRVVENLEPADIKALSRVSKDLRRATSRFLFVSLVVKPRNGTRAERIPLLPSLVKMRHVRHLHLRVSPFEMVDPRCLHWEVAAYPSERDEFDLLPAKSASTRNFDVSARAVSLLSRAGTNKLDSFSWQLGTCLPVSVLQRLVTKQKKLTTLRLGTDGHCETIPDPDPLGSVKFGKLKSFAWSGITDLFAASCFLYRHRYKLQHLDLSLSSTVPFHREETLAPDDCFLHHIWDVNGPRNIDSPGKSLKVLKLHSLRELCLSRMPISTELVTDIVDMQRLESLVLRECPGWTTVLAAVAAAEGDAVALRTLEIQSAMEVWNDDASDSNLSYRWLEVFKKTVHLRRLHLGLEVLMEEDASFRVWEALDVLGDILVDLVVHFREHAALMWRDDSYDAYGGRIIDEDGCCAWNPLSATNLETLGLACSPEHLVSKNEIKDERQDRNSHEKPKMTILKPYAFKSSLRLLHIRHTKTDAIDRGSHAYLHVYFNRPGATLKKKFTDLAEWAFGPRGIQSLQVIAYGEFALGYPWPGHSLFLVRNRRAAGGYDEVQVEDDLGRRLCIEYKLTLEACPLIRGMIPGREMNMEDKTRLRLQRPHNYYEGDTDNESMLSLQGKTEDEESGSGGEEGVDESSAERYRQRLNLARELLGVMEMAG
ncbi:hypothetical protein CDD80_1716 [Ophiocordyceps camponoti-rufipedis]|uniref:F-box domain-containing protein n=1 Tax=Ophiocordyceps camponoti-rufipedis TaxID=2004952 RepID=A0A2C5Z8X3_9HYPO|nr:hypothetical protein CDD80_1716 [Ophiocordyceps camponoti-rufipedis]